MAWQTQMQSDTPIVETVYTGFLSTADLYDAIHTSVELSKRNHTYLFLEDYRAIEGCRSITDLYYLAQSLATMLDQRLRKALLSPQNPDAKESMRFWENAIYNQGLTVRTFDTREPAIAWLLEGVM